MCCPQSHSLYQCNIARTLIDWQHPQEISRRSPFIATVIYCPLDLPREGAHPTPICPIPRVSIHPMQSIASCRSASKALLHLTLLVLLGM